ncbi:MAG: GNAT family N-acetyltransferase [SAR324 cluster bacterium]|nr:GNAT family N-acetyltransferase [SAR324 cluster bacterium]
MEYTVTNLDQSRGLWFRQFTFPAFQHLLFQKDIETPQSKVVAVGAYLDAKPVGLALARIHETDAQADFLSVYVEKSHRGQGLALKMGATLESTLKARGCASIRVEFENNRPMTASILGLLDKGGYSEPEACAMIGRCHDVRQTNIPFVKKNLLPAAYEILLWKEVPESEKERIRHESQENPWFPETLSPFNEIHIQEPDTCLGLRIRDSGEVIGWHITHRISNDTLRYTATFVRESVQHFGLGVSLIGEGIRRHIAHPDQELKKVTFITLMSMPKAVAFFTRHIRSHIEEFNESMQSIKRLGD